MRIWAGVPLACLALAGCGVKGVTSGQIGCPANEITIVEDNQGWGQRQWVAECRGSRYYCSAHGGGENSTAQVSCSQEKTEEEPSTQATPSTATSGCTTDVECKGDRICQDGKCVSP